MVDHDHVSSRIVCFEPTSLPGTAGFCSIAKTLAFAFPFCDFVCLKTGMSGKALWEPVDIISGCGVGNVAAIVKDVYKFWKGR